MDGFLDYAFTNLIMGLLTGLVLSMFKDWPRWN